MQASISSSFVQWSRCTPTGTDAARAAASAAAASGSRPTAPNELEPASSSTGSPVRSAASTIARVDSSV